MRLDTIAPIYILLSYLTNSHILMVCSASPYKANGEWVDGGGGGGGVGDRGRTDAFQVKHRILDRSNEGTTLKTQPNFRGDL